MLKAIVAVDTNYGIGYNNDLLEHIPEDLKYFKKVTSGHPVIMGKKTYDSLPIKPLPGRLNIIISRKKENNSDNTIFMTKEEADEWIKNNKDSQDIFIIGGARIYNLYVPYCDQIFVTKINKEHTNVDSYFIDLDKDLKWKGYPLSPLKDYQGISYQFWLYKR